MKNIHYPIHSPNTICFRKLCISYFGLQMKLHCWAHHDRQNAFWSWGKVAKLCETLLALSGKESSDAHSLPHHDYTESIYGLPEEFHRGNTAFVAKKSARRKGQMSRWRRRPEKVARDRRWACAPLGSLVLLYWNSQVLNVVNLMGSSPENCRISPLSNYLSKSEPTYFQKTGHDDAPRKKPEFQGDFSRDMLGCVSKSIVDNNAFQIIDYS